ncbi:MAG: 5'/3'-nucleotidase SurE [Rhizobiales bacterium]|nr:5'/3'-nucleotidase SurE [Hyphomicrobiales bacterium]
MRILLANDDGFDAPGLAFLSAAAARISRDLWIVAPDRKWTAASHQLSFDRDLTLTRRAPQQFSCSGSPADCVIAAMTLVLRDNPPDLVLSGVNDGRNAGEDAAYSGTLAIAREATFWGVPAIGFSRTKDGAMGETEISALEALIRRLWENRSAWLVDGGWLSVNLPTTLPAPAAAARIGRDKIGHASEIVARDDDSITWRIRRGRPHTTTPGDENAIINAGGIAVVRHRWNRDDELDPAFLAFLQP